MKVLRARGVQSEARIPFAGLFELAATRAVPSMSDPRTSGGRARGRARAPARRPHRPIRRGRRHPQPPRLLLGGRSGRGAGRRRALAGRIERGCAAVCVPPPRRRSDRCRPDCPRGESSLLDGADLATIRLEGLDRASAAELLRPTGNRTARARLRGPSASGDWRQPARTRSNWRTIAAAGRSPPDARPSPQGPAWQRVPRRFESLPQRTREALVVAAAIDGGEMLCPGPRRAPCSGSTFPTSFPPRPPRSSPYTIPTSSSGTRWPGRPSMARRRRAGGAMCIAPWPAHCPTPTPTAVPGTSRWPRSGPTTRRRRRLSRQAARQAAQRLRSLVPGIRARGAAGRAGQQARQAALRRSRRGLARRSRRPGAHAAGQARRHAADADLAVSIQHLRGHIATRRGPIRKAQQILLAAAERAASFDPRARRRDARRGSERGLLRGRRRGNAPGGRTGSGACSAGVRPAGRSSSHRSCRGWR